MRIELKYIFLILLLSLPYGCAGTLHNFNQQSKLASAKDLLKHGKRLPAIKLLKEITDEKGVPDVTDEAMFRLAIIYLSSSPDAEKLDNSRKLLERLEREYPASLWALQSYPLLEMIIRIRLERDFKSETHQEIEHLKRENKKLKLSIERLKTLDIELEDKSGY